MCIFWGILILKVLIETESNSNFNTLLNMFKRQFLVPTCKGTFMVKIPKCSFNLRTIKHGYQSTI